MHRVDGPGATVDNKFTAGNPAAGVPATTVTPEILNAFQEELAALVEASGQVLNKADNGQLLEALGILLGRTVKQFGATGGGVADDRGAFAAADVVGPIIVPQGTYKVSSNITIANAVEFKPGAKLSIDAGVVVTFSGQVSAPSYAIFSGSGTVVLSNKQTALPEWWGASDVALSGAIINKMIAACTANQTPVHFTQVYPIEEVLTFPSNLPVTASASSTLNGSGSANGIVVSNGNGCRQVFPSLGLFTGFALKLKGTDLGDISVHNIGSCGDAVVIETLAETHPNLLDSKVTVQAVSLCTNAVRVIADNNANVMQGNEVHINFATSCLRAVYFDALGLSPQWDSNAFIFQAIDPTVAIANTRGIESNANDCSRQTFNCASWFGGFAASGVYISGSFNGLSADLGLAEAPASYSKMALVGAGNRVRLHIEANKTTTPVVASATPNNRAAYNGGLPSYGDKEKIRVTLGSNVLAGGIYNAYIYHLKTDGYSETFNIIPAGMNGMTAFNIVDLSLTNANEILIQLMNMSGATINSGTNIDFYFGIGW